MLAGRSCTDDYCTAYIIVSAIVRAMIVEDRLRLVHAFLVILEYSWNTHHHSKIGERFSVWHD